MQKPLTVEHYLLFSTPKKRDAQGLECNNNLDVFLLPINRADILLAGRLFNVCADRGFFNQGPPSRLVVALSKPTNLIHPDSSDAILLNTDFEAEVDLGV